MAMTACTTSAGMVIAKYQAKSVVKKVVVRRSNMKINDIIQEAAGLQYKGYPCTKDCSGHKAGYAWAKKRGVTNPQDCPGVGTNHNSFWEGCKSATEGK